MRICLPAIIALSLLLGVACGDDDDEVSPDALADGAGLLEQVHEAMDAAGGFHLEFTSYRVGDELDTQTGQMDWISEDLFFASNTYVDGPRKQECDSGTDDMGGQYEYCDYVLESIDREQTMEGVSTESGFYFRNCEEGECGGWGYVAKDDPTGLFLGAYADIMLVMLRNLLDDAIAPSVPEEDGGLIYVRAGFNPARMDFEAEKGLTETYGKAFFGESCYGGTGWVGISVDGEDTESTPVQEAGCEGYTLEEYEAANQELFEKWDGDPAIFEVWIDPDSLTIARLVFNAPEVELVDASDGGWRPPYGREEITHTEMVFSKYGNVQVAVPELDLD